MGVRHIFYHLRPDQIRWSTRHQPTRAAFGQSSFMLTTNSLPDISRTIRTGIRLPIAKFAKFRRGSSFVSARRAFGRALLAFSPAHKNSLQNRSPTTKNTSAMFSGSRCAAGCVLTRPVLAELSGGLDSSSIVCMADDILANEGAEAPRLDTLSYYDKTEPKGDDWIYFQKIEEKRGRAGHPHRRQQNGQVACLAGVSRVLSRFPARLESATNSAMSAPMRFAKAVAAWFFRDSVATSSWEAFPIRARNWRSHRAGSIFSSCEASSPPGA